MKNVSVDHAAKIIAVSSATIRNWTKAGHITPISERPFLFTEESVLTLKNQIGSDAFPKLKIRANKAAAANTFLPEEYIDSPSLASHIASLLSTVTKFDLDAEAVIYLAALRQLELNGEVQRKIEGDLFNLTTFHSWVRTSVKNEMEAWRNALRISKSTPQYHQIFAALTPDEGDDFLGLLYQSIFMEGHKSSQGSYYTPTKLVADALSFIEPSIKTFLDPCCGSGKYLLMASRQFNLHPENIYGFDCDHLAIRIARINLLMAFKERGFPPRVFCMDSLSSLATGEVFCETNHLLGTIDAIATNPPWGAYKNAAAKSAHSASIKSGETFALFLAKSIQLLRAGGQLSFILPESILKIKIHADIRAHLLRQTSIATIAMLGRQFTGVFTPVIRLDATKAPATKASWVKVQRDGMTDLIAQSRFEGNDGFAFDVSTHSHEENLLHKLYSIKHSTLAKNAEWALGIVTGNNKKFILDDFEPDAEAVYRGSDVYPYVLGEPHSFIRFTPDAFQQVAQARFYRAPEKLIYKFISKRLVCL